MTFCRTPGRRRAADRGAEAADARARPRSFRTAPSSARSSFIGPTSLTTQRGFEGVSPPCSELFPRSDGARVLGPSDEYRRANKLVARYRRSAALQCSEGQSLRPLDNCSIWPSVRSRYERRWVAAAPGRRTPVRKRHAGERAAAERAAVPTATTPRRPDARSTSARRSTRFEHRSRPEGETLQVVHSGGGGGRQGRVRMVRNLGLLLIGLWKRIRPQTAPSNCKPIRPRLTRFADFDRRDQRNHRSLPARRRTRLDA